jgi:hypothetical protein
MHRLRRFARFWDLIANSGNFVESRDLIWQESGSPFTSFLALSDWLFDCEQRAHGIPLVKLSHRLFEFLTTVNGLEKEVVAQLIWRDYVRGGRRDRPAFLRPFDLPQPDQAIRLAEPAQRRQALHAKS